MRLSDIIRHVKGIFETKRKNPVLLENDSNLESRLKFLRVAKSNTPIQISDDTINVQGSLTVNGTSVSTEPDDDSAVVTALNSATENELVTVGATTTELDAEAKLTFDGADLSIAATGKIYLDGGTHSYISETSDGVVDFYANNVRFIRIKYEAGNLSRVAFDHEVVIQDNTKLLFDGTITGHTYIIESADDILDFYVGGDKMLSLDETVDTGVTSLIGTLKIAEQADASADTAGYGQLWVDTATPNELSFTDDAGTDIIGIGKYHYESKMANYTAVATGNFIPLSGGTVERTSTAGQNEYIAMVAPYNGTIEKILWRSEESQDGTMEMDIYESADETEVPGTITGTKDTVLDRENDDITFDVSFASMTSGVNTLTKGRIYAIKITTPSAPGDTNTTVVFKWDVTS